MEEIDKILGEIGCDPLQLSAELAMGNSIIKPHKDLPRIKAKWNMLLVGIKKGELKQTTIDDLWYMIESALSVTKPSNEIQSKHIISLTEYLHSKKKSIENISKVKHYEKLEDIPDDVLEKIALGEDVNFTLGGDDDSIASN